MGGAGWREGRFDAVGLNAREDQPGYETEEAGLRRHALEVLRHRRVVVAVIPVFELYLRCVCVVVTPAPGALLWG